MKDAMGWKSPGKWLASIAVFAVIYYVAARLSLLLAFANTNASPVWPPSGMAMGAILLLGYRLWPSIFIGAFAANMTAFAANHVAINLSTACVSLSIAGGNTLEALSGALLLRYLLSGEDTFTQAANIYKFVLVATLAGLLSTVIGTTSLIAGGIAPVAAQWTILSTWWLGDVAGILVVTPLILAWSTPWERPRSVTFMLMLIASLFVVTSILAMIFSQQFPIDATRRWLAYLVLPCIGWFAYRYGRRGETLLLTLVTGSAVLATTHGLGPFVFGTLQDSLDALEIFIALCSIVGLVLAADVNENMSIGSFASLRKKIVLFSHWLILFLCLGLTIFSWHVISSNTESHARDRFEYIAENARQRIVERMAVYKNLLYAGRGLFGASQQVERQEWEQFFTHLKVEKNFPGIVSFGYAKKIDTAGMPAIEQALHADGIENFHIWPAVQGQQPVSVFYIEPTSEENRHQLGYDMTSDSRLLAAMSHARDTGEVAVTQKMTRMGENGHYLPTEFLMYLPIYRNGAIINSPQDRVAALDGYIYATMRMDFLMRGILATSTPDVALTIYDGEHEADDAVMYSSKSEFVDNNDYHNPFSVKKNISIIEGEHNWTLRVNSLPLFEGTIDRQKSLIVLIAGTIISLLFFSIVRSLTHTREKAQEIADEMTGTLQETNQTLHQTIQQLSDKSVALTHAQQELQIIIDHMPALIVYWDNQLLNRFANKAYFEWFGVLPQDMRGRHIKEIIGQDRFTQIEPRLRSALQGKVEIFEQVIRYHNKDERHALFSYIPDIEEGKVKGLYGFISDITQLKHAQFAQAVALSQLQSTIDAASEFAIITTDLDGIIRMFSVGAEKMLAYSADEIVGKKTPVLFHNADELHIRSLELTAEFCYPIEGLAVFFEHARHGEAETREWTYVRKDGTSLLVQITVTAILGMKGEVTGFLSIAKDIREEREATEKLREAMEKAESASRAKSEFVANMSHELRTPMNAVLGITHLLGNTDLSLDQKKYLDMIRASGESLLVILNEILDFSKIEAGRMELSFTPFQLDDVLNVLSAIMSVNAGEKNLELAIGVELDVPRRLIGDMTRLQQILVNLTGNAIKFTQTGEVSVLVSVLEQQAGLSNNQVMLRFSVRDTGIGMNEEQLSRLFGAFSQADSSVTRRFGGTGLGLVISRRLAELMGGTIDIRSELGKGSEFNVSIPMQIADEQGDSRSRGKALGNLRFLIVDDNETSRDYLSKTILAWNWAADSSQSGTQAMAYMLAATEKGPRYDVVLVDWQMREPNGLPTVDIIRDLTQKLSIPVILMVNAFGRAKLIEANAASRVDAILTKPVTGSSLFDTLHEVLISRMEDADIDMVKSYSQSSDQRLDGISLLLVEDNHMNQIVARGILEYAGASVDIAENGKLAIDILRTDITQYDLILMDVQMPVMDGFTATKLIRQELGIEIPVLGMTAGVTESEREQCMHVGMNDVIAKPIEVEQMLATILRHVGERNADAEGDIGSDDDNIPTFDPDQLLAIGEGNDAYLIAIIELFNKVVTTGVTPALDAHQAFLDGKLTDSARMLHSMRGAIGTLGAKRLAKLAYDIEMEIFNTENHTLESQFHSLKQEFEAVIAAMTTWLSEHAAPQGNTDQISPLDDEQIRQLKLFLLEKNLAAIDLYASLRLALSHYQQQIDMVTLDNAMATLDFETAKNCLDAIK